MPQMIDIADVEAGMEEFRARERKKTDLPGVQGVVARAQLAVSPELTLWRVKELNRGTDPNEVMNGIVALVAATLAGEVLAVPMPKDRQIAVINRTLTAIAEEVVSILSGQADMTIHRHEFKEAGNA
jgi:hypothetical protein